MRCPINSLQSRNLVASSFIPCSLVKTREKRVNHLTAPDLPLRSQNLNRPCTTLFVTCVILISMGTDMYVNL